MMILRGIHTVERWKYHQGPKIKGDLSQLLSLVKKVRYSKKIFIILFINISINMEAIMLFKFKRMPTKKENSDATKAVNEALKKGVKIETYHTYGIYDAVTHIVGSQKATEESYISYLQMVKPWADVCTMNVIDEDLYQKVTKKSIKD